MEIFKANKLKARNRIFWLEGNFKTRPELRAVKKRLSSLIVRLLFLASFISGRNGINHRIHEGEGGGTVGV